MRVPCVSIFLAIATRPVQTRAHAEPSVIVSTDGQIEAQRRLRVHERAGDADNDERVNSQVKEIINSNARDDAANLLTRMGVDLRLGRASDEGMSNLNSLSVKINKYKSWKEAVSLVEAKTFVKSLYEAHTNNHNPIFSEKPKIRFERLIFPFLGIHEHSLLYKVHNLFLATNTKPDVIFELFQLEDANDQVFKQTHLNFWVKYTDAFYEKAFPKVKLLHILTQHYSIDTLAAAVFTTSKNKKIVSRVEKELQEYFLTKNYSPDEVFTFFKLHEAGDTLFGNPLLYFWTRYVIVHNSKVLDEAKASMNSVLISRVDPIVLNNAKSSDVTIYLEEELRDMRLKEWKDQNLSKRAVSRIAKQEKKGDEEQITVYDNALRKAVRAYGRVRGDRL